MVLREPVLVLLETHPMYMGEARQIPGYIEEWNPNQA